MPRGELARFGVKNAEVVEGDGTEGLPEHAPYDAILVAAAFPSVPRPLQEQLAAGGRLVQPVGHGGREEVVLFQKDARELVRRRTIAWARFVRLHGARVPGAVDFRRHRLERSSPLLGSSSLGLFC